MEDFHKHFSGVCYLDVHLQLSLSEVLPVLLETARYKKVSVADIHEIEMQKFEIHKTALYMSVYV